MRFETADFDLKITGITIIDGTGEPGYLGDVGIRDGKNSLGNTLPGGLIRGSCDRAVAVKKTWSATRKRT